MPLPFLKHKNDSGIAGMLIAKRKPDGAGMSSPSPAETETEESKDSDGIDSAASDLIVAVHARDSKAVAAALRAAFEICDSEPHEEGEHTNPHSYDAQNEKAAK